VSCVGFQIHVFTFEVSGVVFSDLVLLVWGDGFRVSGFGLRVSGSVFRIWCCWFRVPGFGFRVSGWVFRIWCRRFRVLGFRFRVSGFGFSIPGLVLLVSGLVSPLWH